MKKYIIEFEIETDDPVPLFGEPLPENLSEQDRKTAQIQRIGTEPIYVATIAMLQKLLGSGALNYFRVRLPDQQ